MFDEDMEEKKAGMIGAAIIGGIGLIGGVLGKIGFDKGMDLWKKHKEKKADEASTEAK